MGVEKYTLNIEEHITGGAKCSKPDIKWDETNCAGIVCEKNNGRTIKVAIPDDCDECFYVNWQCLDPCDDDCDPIRLRICPCNGPEDCPDGCSDCIGNMCVSRCEDGEFCNDADICVECDDEHPCTNGKVCVDGACVCPPSKPYLDSKGNCVPCNATSCPPGQKCTPDGCIPIDCPEGVWHPTKEKCVECLNSGHCGLNECCNEENECECCEGFIRDYSTDPPTCVPKGPCETDEDCPDCTYCDVSTCVPINCGPGKICIPGEGCVPECNCDDPDCMDEGSACVSYSADVCYCKKCTGSCAEGCSDGCICDEDDPDGGCIPNPCSNTPCEDGSECGEGCGCNPDTKKCEPCSSAECGEECDHLLGCHCPNGTSCQDVIGCEGPCSGYGDCAPGCTCVEGQCVPCADFSCDNDDCENHPECGCTGGKCVGDPDFCEDEFSTDDFACGVSAELKLADGCMCPAITAYTFPYEITKIAGVSSQYDVKLAIRLAKGYASDWPNVGSLHILDQTQFPDIADNDTPTSGNISLEIREYYQPQVWQNNTWVNQGPITYRVLNDTSFSFAGIARKENIVFRAYGINSPKNVISQSSQERIIRYEIDVDSNTLKFPNGCDYQPQELDVLRLDSQFKFITDALDASGFSTFYDTTFYISTGNYNIGQILSQWESFGSDSVRKPLFTWYRSEDNIYTDSDIIRKIYIGEDSPGRYEDILFGPAVFDPKKDNLTDPEGRVFGNMYYKVTNDCGCDDRELDLGKLRWCDPENLVLGNIVFSSCNKKVEIKSDISRPCATNRYLPELNLHSADNTTAFKNAHQAKYHLVIELSSGTSVDIPYVWRDNGIHGPGLYKVPKTDTIPIEPIKQFVQIFNSEIVALRLELRYGTSDEVVCQWDKAVPDPATNTPTYITTCLEDGKISYRFNLVTNHITNITAVGGIVVSGNGYKEVVATAGTEVTVNLEFTDYCPLTMKLNGNCCDTLSISVQKTENNGVTELTAQVVGGVAPFRVEYYLQTEGGSELVGDTTNHSNQFKVVLTSPEPGLYYGLVVDVNDCNAVSSVISIEPIDPEDYPVPITPLFNGCAYTGNVRIGIPAQPNVVGSQIFYKVDSGPEQAFTVTNQMYSAGQHQLSAQGHTITLIRLEIPNPAGPDTVITLSGSATVPANLTGEVPAVTTFTINGSSNSVSICTGDEILIELQGTPNSVVEFNSIGPITLDGTGYGSTTQNPIVNTLYTITLIRNTSGSCTGAQGLGITRAVAVSPMPSINVLSDTCDATLTFRTITFNNITSATDQLGNALIVSGNAVTVDTRLGVTAVHVEFDNGICVATYIHPVQACDCPTITGTLSPVPDTVCEGGTFTLTVSGVTGGTGPYAYNYYTDSEYNENYVVGQTSKIFGPVETETYYVRVRDANGCISLIGSVTIPVVSDPVPNIIAQAGQPGIDEVSDNVFEIVNTMDTAVFKTDSNYTNVSWLVTGTYGGTNTGTEATFSLEVAEITGTIILKVSATNEAGCIGTEEVAITVVDPPSILENDEILFSTQSRKIYKATLSPSAVGIPVLLCGANQPAQSVAMAGDGSLVGALGTELYYLDVLTGCAADFIGSMQHVNSLGMLNGTKLISLGSGVTKNTFATYDLNTDTPNNAFYIISDAPNDYHSTGDIVRVGNYLYCLANQFISGVFSGPVLLRMTLDGSDNITAFLNLGALPSVVGSAFGLAKFISGPTIYLVYSSGLVYNLDVVTPANSTYIGSLVVPGSDAIYDATNNFA